MSYAGDPHVRTLQAEVAWWKNENRKLRAELDSLNDLVNLQAANTVALEAQLRTRTAERDKLADMFTDMREEYEMAEAEARDLRHEVEDLKLDLRREADG